MVGDRVVNLAAEPESLRINLDRTALLIIDMQNAFASKGGMFELGGRDISHILQIIPNVVTMADACRVAKIRVVYVAQRLTPDLREIGPFSRFRSPARRQPEFRDRLLFQGTWGAEIIDELKPRPDEMVIEKKLFSAFAGTELDIMLRSLDIKFLLFAGVATNICVESSLRDACHLQYLPVLVSDAAAASPAERHEASVGNVRDVFGWVTRTADVLSALR